jgi:hypothetical protein
MPTGFPPAYLDPGGRLPPSSWGMVLPVLLAALSAGLAALKIFGSRLRAFLARHRRTTGCCPGKGTDEGSPRPGTGLKAHWLPTPLTRMRSA